MENIIFSHVTGNMLLAFIVGVALIFIYGKWKSENIDLKNGYTVKKYTRLTLINVLFQLVAGFLVLFIIHEIAEKVLAFSGIEGSKGYHLTLSALCGCLGGQFFAFIIEKGRMLLNKRDKEIAHLERPELDN